jgi:hypothetical protein
VPPPDTELSCPLRRSTPPRRQCIALPRAVCTGLEAGGRASGARGKAGAAGMAGTSQRSRTRPAPLRSSEERTGRPGGASCSGGCKAEPDRTPAPAPRPRCPAAVRPLRCALGKRAQHWIRFHARGVEYVEGGGGISDPPAERWRVVWGGGTNCRAVNAARSCGAARSFGAARRSSWKDKDLIQRYVKDSGVETGLLIRQVVDTHRCIQRGDAAARTLGPQICLQHSRFHLASNLPPFIARDNNY